MRIEQRFIAFDGREFSDRAECEGYEAANIEARLVGLTIEQVRAAIERTDSGLADAIEAVGTKIARARRDAGELRRVRKGAPDIQATEDAA